jgi:hypothetical protein
VRRVAVPGPGRNGRKVPTAPVYLGRRAG